MVNEKLCVLIVNCKFKNKAADLMKVVHHYVGFRHHRSKLSSQSISTFNCLLLEMKRFIPKEFNRKPRPLSKLSPWKAAELRLFLLYVGVVLLKHQGMLTKARYRHFLKFSVAMRILLSSNTCDEDMPLCSKLLKKFCYDGIQLYDRGFITYNIHSLIHLVDDFILNG